MKTNTENTPDVSIRKDEIGSSFASKVLDATPKFHPEVLISVGNKGCGKGYDEDCNLEAPDVFYPYKVCGRTSQDGLFLCPNCVNEEIQNG